MSPKIYITVLGVCFVLFFIFAVAVLQKIKGHAAQNMILPFITPLAI